MILDIYSPKQIQQGISRIETNLECIKTGNYSQKEKQDLREIYINQMKKYKEIQVSFYTGFLN